MINTKTIATLSPSCNQQETVKSIAVMLSGETSVGKYPIAAAQTIQRIAKVPEEYIHQNEHARIKTITRDKLVLTAALVSCKDRIVDDISAKPVEWLKDMGCLNPL